MYYESTRTKVLYINFELQNRRFSANSATLFCRAYFNIFLYIFQLENSFDGTSYQIVKALLENGLFFPRKWNFAAVSHSDSKWCKAVHIIQIDAIASVNLYK